MVEWVSRGPSFENKTLTHTLFLFDQCAMMTIGIISWLAKENMRGPGTPSAA